jgi:hypothetical protein
MGHMKFDTHNPKIILEKNKINLVQVSYCMFGIKVL